MRWGDEERSDVVTRISHKLLDIFKYLIVAIALGGIAWWLSSTKVAQKEAYVVVCVLGSLAFGYIGVATLRERVLNPHARKWILLPLVVVGIGAIVAYLWFYLINRR